VDVVGSHDDHLDAAGEEVVLAEHCAGHSQEHKECVVIHSLLSLLFSMRNKMC